MKSLDVPPLDVVAAELVHCFGRMAAHPSISFQRPLQNAMRIVKVAIQLDTGSRHKVQPFELYTYLNLQIWSHVTNIYMRVGGHLSV